MTIEQILTKIKSENKGFIYFPPMKNMTDDVLKQGMILTSCFDGKIFLQLKGWTVTKDGGREYTWQPLNGLNWCHLMKDFWEYDANLDSVLAKHRWVF